jgi:hypothetical protein
MFIDHIALVISCKVHKIKVFVLYANSVYCYKQSFLWIRDSTNDLNDITSCVYCKLASRLDELMMRMNC